MMLVVTEIDQRPDTAPPYTVAVLQPDRAAGLSGCRVWFFALDGLWKELPADEVPGIALLCPLCDDYGPIFLLDMSEHFAERHPDARPGPRPTLRVAS